jgi:hypothetical protein
MARAHARACMLSVMPGNSRRNSTAAANSPPRSKAVRIATASDSETTNIPGAWGHGPGPASTEGQSSAQDDPSAVSASRAMPFLHINLETFLCPAVPARCPAPALLAGRRRQTRRRRRPPPLIAWTAGCGPGWATIAQRVRRSLYPECEDRRELCDFGKRNGRNLSHGFVEECAQRKRRACKGQPTRRTRPCTPRNPAGNA